MRRHQRVTASGVRRPQSERLRRRQRWYFALMGVCLLLILLAWNLVGLWSAARCNSNNCLPPPRET